MNTTLSRIAGTAALLAASCLGDLHAQSQQLLGITQNFPLIQQHDQGACVVNQRCQLPFAVPPGALAGASAWDATRSVLWVSTGFTLSAWEDDNCNPVCPPQPSPLPGQVSGLAIFERAGALFEMDINGNILQYQLACPPVPGQACQINSLLPNAFVFTALASDDLRQLLFIGCTNPVTGANAIQVASLSDPCNPFAIFQMGSCPSPGGPIALFGPLTGLAADSCKQVVYATDGVQIQELTYAIPALPPSIGFLLSGCCQLSTSISTPLDPYAGLAIRPLRARRLGQPCSSGACAPCLPRLVERSDPVLGNPNYGVSLVNAPGDSIAWIAFNVGSCSMPGVPAPPLCAPLLVPVNNSLAIFGAVGTGGTPGNCDGAANVNGGLPLNPVLCGIEFSAQAGIFCFGNATGTVGDGTAVTSCRTTVLQGL